MAIKRQIIFMFFLFHTSLLCGQNYVDYHRTFNRIDKDILSNNYREAIKQLDSIYSKFDFIYAKHCFKALQICVSANDSIKADKWLEKSFKQGIPIWIIRINEITNKSLSYSTTQKTLNSFDSLHSIYNASINTKLREKIDSILIIDQKFTQKMNTGFVLFKPIFWLQWGAHNKRQLKLLKKIIETYGYPEERLIGLSTIQDSAAFARTFTFWGPSELRDSKVQIMLQHCYSTWHTIDIDFKDALFKNLCDGNIPAFQFALIIDFMFPDKPKYMKENYFKGNGDLKLENIEKMNESRNSIGLPNIEQEKRNILINIERRKNKKANSEIMLET